MERTAVTDAKVFSGVVYEKTINTSAGKTLRVKSVAEMTSFR